MLALPPIIGKIITPIITHATAIILLAAVVILVSLILLIIYSDLFLIRKYKAKKTDNQQLLNIVEELSLKAEITPPALYITPVIGTPNVLSLGKTPKIILTQSAVDNLFLEETTSLMAKAIAEIKQSNMFLKTVTAVLCGLLTSIPTIALWTALLTGFGQEDDPAPKMFKLLATATVAPIAAIPLQVLRLKEQREEIDRFASQLAETEILQQAQKTVDYDEIISQIQSKQQARHFKTGINPSHAFLFAVDPLPADDEKMNVYNGLFTGTPVKWRYIFFFSTISYTGLFFMVTVITTFAKKDFMLDVVALQAQAYFPLILFTLLFCYSLLKKNQQTTPI